MYLTIFIVAHIFSVFASVAYQFLVRKQARKKYKLDVDDKVSEKLLPQNHELMKWIFLIANIVTGIGIVVLLIIKTSHWCLFFVWKK